MAITIGITSPDNKNPQKMIFEVLGVVAATSRAEMKQIDGIQVALSSSKDGRRSMFEPVNNWSGASWNTMLKSPALAYDTIEVRAVDAAGIVLADSAQRIHYIAVQGWVPPCGCFLLMAYDDKLGKPHDIWSMDPKVNKIGLLAEYYSPTTESLHRAKRCKKHRGVRMHEWRDVVWDECRRANKVPQLVSVQRRR